ncbi:MAG: alkene reductase [Bacteroidota bacterium]
MKNLLSQYSKLGTKNRVVMAPMTRSRATAEHVPTPIMATYYAQRATAGLIITEGTAPSPNGVGYTRIPGIYTDEQAEAWKTVTDAVHQAGGKIFLQLMHTGRLAHPENMPEGALILAPSSIRPETTKMYVDGKGMIEIPTPQTMTLENIQTEIEFFVEAAQKAVQAGFDGVELHAANGYLLEAFISPVTNHRTDEYGGSIQNRVRFALEVVKRVSDAIGADRVGIRISPNGTLGDMLPFEGQTQTYEYLIDELDRLNIAYVNLLDLSSFGQTSVPMAMRTLIRQRFSGTLILSGGYDQYSAETALANDEGDLIAFGRPFIANPDLIERWKSDAPLNEANKDLFYTPGEKGYIDYPMLQPLAI